MKSDNVESTRDMHSPGLQSVSYTEVQSWAKNSLPEMESECSRMLAVALPKQLGASCNCYLQCLT